MKKINIPINDLLKKYYLGYSTSYLAEFYNCSVITIQRKLKKANCEFRPIGHGCKKYKINEHYFDIINNEGKAYWLGVMLTDGSTSGKMIRLGFKKEDELHLQKFLDSISSNHPIKHQEKDGFIQSIVAIGNKHMRESLVYKGIEANNKQVYNVKENLERHYWRGAIDGDGQIVARRRTIGLVGNKNTCENFKKFCLKHVNSKARVKKHGNIWCYRLHGDIAFDIAKLLYLDANVYLERKFIEFQNWLQEFEKKPVYPQVVRFFKKKFSNYDISIRREKMPKHLDGECILKNGKYLIRIDKTLNDNEAINCLLHELSHIKTIVQEKDPHGTAFGIAYSKIYKMFEKEFTYLT